MKIEDVINELASKTIEALDSVNRERIVLIEINIRMDAESRPSTAISYDDNGKFSEKVITLDVHPSEIDVSR